MNNFGKLKQVLLGHLTRNAISMETEVGSVDMLGVAVNSAMTHIQRLIDFEWNKGTIKVHCNPTGSLVEQTVDHTTGKEVVIKRIIQAYGHVEPKQGMTSAKIDYLSKTSDVVDKTYGERCLGPRVIHSACDVYMSPAPAEAYHLYFEAVKWMPELEHDSDRNFLFVYGFDYLIYRSMLELNFYIKEDQRFDINTALLNQAQNSLIAWNTSLLSPTETEIEL